MTRRQLGVLALLSALSLIWSAVALLVPTVRLARVGPVALTVLQVLVGFAFWKFMADERRRGANLLLAALACTLLAAIPRYAISLLRLPSGTQLAFLSAGFASLTWLLFAVGLLRSRLVPAWIPWLRIAPAALSPLALLLLALAVSNAGVTPLIGYAQIGLFGLGGLLEFLFWLFVALSLLRENNDDEALREPAPAQHAHPADCGA